jgi:hypothetical protein
MTMILIQVTDSKLDDLVRTAIMYGWTRDNPEKKWTVPEKKAAARYIINRMIHEPFKIP